VEAAEPAAQSRRPAAAVASSQHCPWQRQQQRSKQWQQQRSRHPPAATGQRGDATGPPNHARARGQRARDAGGGCPGPGQRARSHSAARGWLAWPRTERDERRGQIQRRRRSYSRRAARPTAAACGRPRRRPAPRWIPWAPARGMAAAAWRTEPAAAPSHTGRPQIRINSAPF
jgi:hypothetical protein